MPFDPSASFGKSLFFGDILEDQLFPYPEMPREQAELVEPIVETIDKYMASIDHRGLDRSGEMSPASFSWSRSVVIQAPLRLEVRAK